MDEPDRLGDHGVVARPNALGTIGAFATRLPAVPTARRAAGGSTSPTAASTVTTDPTATAAITFAATAAAASSTHCGRMD